MTQPQPVLSYETPRELRLADADPRWIAKLLAGAVIMAAGLAVRILRRGFPLAPSMSTVSWSAITVTLHCIAAWLLTARPALPVGSPLLRVGLRVLVTIQVPLTIGLNLLLARIFIGTGPNPMPAWYSPVNVTSITLSAIQSVLLYYYLNLLLRLIPSPHLANQLMIIGMTLAANSMFPISVILRLVFGPSLWGLGRGLPFSVYGMVSLVLHGWALAVVILGCIKLNTSLTNSRRERCGGLSN